jgi:hypothetical protein
MGGKYSAEWWEKIANINSEASKPRDNPDQIDYFLQSIARKAAVPVRDSEDLPPSP